MYVCIQINRNTLARAWYIHVTHIYIHTQLWWKHNSKNHRRFIWPCTLSAPVRGIHAYMHIYIYRQMHYVYIPMYCMYYIYTYISMYCIYISMQIHTHVNCAYGEILGVISYMCWLDCFIKYACMYARFCSCACIKCADTCLLFGRCVHVCECARIKKNILYVYVSTWSYMCMYLHEAICVCIYMKLYVYVSTWSEFV
jgi:hypothetical protein